MKALGGAGRPRISAVAAIVGMGIAGFSVAMLGAGALLASDDGEGGGSRPPGTQKSTLSVTDSNVVDPNAVDPNSTVDADSERIRFANFEKECMRAQGFDWQDAAFDPAPPGSSQPGTIRWTEGQNLQVVAALNDALFGTTGPGDTYRWEEAGCHGYAVHMSGNDGKH
jgi:hypothetical protein